MSTVFDMCLQVVRTEQWQSSGFVSFDFLNHNRIYFASTSENVEMGKDAVVFSFLREHYGVGSENEELRLLEQEW